MFIYQFVLLYDLPPLHFLLDHQILHLLPIRHQLFKIPTTKNVTQMRTWINFKT